VDPTAELAKPDRLRKNPRPGKKGEKAKKGKKTDQSESEEQVRKIFDFSFVYMT